MIKFVLTFLVMTVWGWLLWGAIQTSWWLYALMMVGLFVAGWFLQTDAEKEATKKWWYDRL